MSDKIKTVMKNSLVTAVILGIVTVLCFILQRVNGSDTHAALLFVLAVLFISRLTDGYAYGIAASMIAVAGVNYVFTFPYFELNFSITGYPVMFVTMLAVACSVSALTTQIKKQEHLRLEAETEKMRGNLLRAVSHDIRTPLTSIMGSASGLIDNFNVLPDGQKLELLEDIREEAQWLIQIVENLLSITRMSSHDAARIDKQDELAEEIISEAVLKFRKLFPEIEVAVSVPDEVVMVPMDGILVEQVLINLMENSALHGKSTTKIAIRAWAEDDKIFFCVEDDGKGIGEDILPVMFDGRLLSEKEDGSDSKRNMGIGLSVCMSIVKAHEGNMSAENITSKGARVSFWLPLTKGEEHGN